MDDIDFSRRGVLTLTAALPSGGTWIWKGPMRSPEPGFTTGEVSFDTGPGSTAESLAGATSENEWAARLAKRLGATRRIRVPQNGVERARAELAGPVAAASGEVTSVGTVTDVTTTPGSDTAAGSWTLVIEGGQRYGAFVRIALDPVGELPALSSDAAAAKAMGLAASFRLKAPLLELASAPVTAPASGPELQPRIGPFARAPQALKLYPTQQFEWNANGYSSHPLPATRGTRRVEIRRNGAVVKTVDSIGAAVNGANSAGVQDGDEIWVYPAVYGDQQPDGIVLGGNHWIANNIKIKGVTVRNRRPVLKGCAPGTQWTLCALDNCVNTTIENIDFDVNSTKPGFVYMKAAVIVNGVTNLTMRDCRVVNGWAKSVHGIFGNIGTWRGTLLFENCEIARNGGNAAPEHNVYLNYPDLKHNLTAKVIVRGCFHSARNGHHFKSRCLDNTIEGCYFMGTPNILSNSESAESFNIELCGGGNAVVRNNVITKTFGAGNQFGICIGTDLSRAGSDPAQFPGSYPGTRFSIVAHNNTFVYFSQASAEPVDARALIAWKIDNGGKAVAPGPRGSNMLPNQSVAIRDNVYVGIPVYGAPEFDWWRTADVGAVISDRDFSIINLPGMDPGEPFALKKPVASSDGIGGRGQPLYLHQASRKARADNNKGARG